MIAGEPPESPKELVLPPCPECGWPEMDMVTRGSWQLPRCPECGYTMPVPDVRDSYDG